MMGKWLPYVEPVKDLPQHSPESALNTNDSLEIWCPSTLGELVGENPAMHRRLLSKFLLKATDQITAIEQAAKAQDITTIADLAHTLKSAARTVGALSLGELCQTIETKGRTGDPAQCIALTKGMPMAFKAAAELIEKHLAA
jgi:HPt (histidine-containing phosphotransfer) domain-containing protein